MIFFFFLSISFFLIQLCFRNHIIHIMDPNAPWTLCSLVGRHKYCIKTLKWSAKGLLLLSADENGTVCLWKMKSHLVNEWYCEYTLNCAVGEEIIALAWLPNGPQVCVSAQHIQELFYFYFLYILISLTILHVFHCIYI